MELLPTRCQSCANFIGEYHGAYEQFLLDKKSNPLLPLKSFFDNLFLYFCRSGAYLLNKSYTYSDLVDAAKEYFYPFRIEINKNPDTDFSTFYSDYILKNGKASTLLPCCERSFISPQLIQTNEYFYGTRVKEIEKMIKSGEVERIETNVFSIEDSEKIIEKHKIDYADFYDTDSLTIMKVNLRPITKSTRSYFVM